MRIALRAFGRELLALEVDHTAPEQEQPEETDGVPFGFSGSVNLQAELSDNWPPAEARSTTDRRAHP